MAYVEKFKTKGRTYYRLVHTIRKNKRITHRTKYIGRVLPSKARLEQLKEEFSKEILQQRYKYLSGEDVEKIEKKKLDYKKEIKRLSPLEKENALEEFMIRFTYDSNKLSGLPITLRQTSLILKEGVIPRNIKSLRTMKELENHEKGFAIIIKYKGILDLKFIRKLHLTLFAGVDDEIAGKLRSELKRNVKLTGTPYVPPKWQDLKKELTNFFKWYRAKNRKLHPLELAALIHLKLISIQPFVDGNSRLSRLLMNWVLWKKSYPLVDIPIEELENYYSVIDKYQLEGRKEKPFIDYIRKRYLKA